MQLKSVRKYLWKLLTDGYKWQYLDISGNGKKPFLFFSSTQLIILLISISSFAFMPKGLNEQFVGYIISSLSIFVGLFLTLILSVFDKFQSLFRKPDDTELDKEFKNQRINFFKQFTSLTSYAIILAILCILLLSLSYITDRTKLNIFYEDFFFSFCGIIKIDSVKFLSLLFIAFYNICIIYFLLDFLLIVIYAVASIHTYMMIEYNKKA